MIKANETSHHEIDHPSAWVSRFAKLIPRGEVLDLACGSGRHARLLAGLGYEVLAVDRDAGALEYAKGEGITTLRHDLESGGAAGADWPFVAERFSGIVVTNYLHRPLFDYILNSLAAGGVLIYETFSMGNERYGKPSNPAFLLQPGELLRLGEPSGGHLRIIAFEDGYVTQPRPAMIQRICAVKSNPIPDPERLFPI